MGNFNRGDRSGDRGGRDRFKGRSGSFDRGGNGGFDRGNRNSGGRPEMHKAVCSECGDNCEVPFRPTGEKPVLCSTCFGNKNGGSDSRRSGGRNFDRPSFNRSSFEEKRMFEAVCDKCGKECEVPFQPTSGKPVYCSDCFDKGDNGRARNGGGASKEQFEQLNAKLDSILKALGVTVEKKAETKKAPKVETLELPELDIFEPVEVLKKSVKKTAVKKVSKKAVTSKSK